MCVYMLLDNWINESFGTMKTVVLTESSKGKKNKNITESHIMLQKIQVLQLYAFIQNRFHGDTS